MAAVNETMAEGLKKLLSAIAQLKILPDADLQFLTGLEGGIVDYIRAQAASTAGAATGTGPQSSISDVMPPSGGMGGGGMGGGMPGGMGGGGMMGLAAQPNPDELRRLMNVGG